MQVNPKRELKETGWEDVELIYLTRNRYGWRVLKNTVIKFLGPYRKKFREILAWIKNC